MNKEEIRKFVKGNAITGALEHEGEQIPFVAVPNPKHGEPLDVETILEALRANAKEEK